LDSAKIDSPKRVIHKHLSFEKFRKQRIEQDNSKMVNRILNSECEVQKVKSTEKAFRNHLVYQNIRRRYNENGLRKDVLALGESEMLCPTLLEFNSSGLASRFVEMDLSMSVKPATAGSMRRSSRGQPS
jgi:hypothetical protein